MANTEWWQRDPTEIVKPLTEQEWNVRRALIVHFHYEL